MEQALNKAAEEEFLNIGGSSIYSCKWTVEKESGPPLVFMHEGLGSVESWLDIPASLSKTLSCNCFAYDRRGYGKSEDYNFEGDAEFMDKEADVFLPKYIEAIGIDKPVLIGHSDGAAISLIYGARNPDKIYGVVAIAAHAVVDEDAIEGIKDTLANSQDKLMERLVNLHGDKAEQVLRNWSSTWLSDELGNFDICFELTSLYRPVLAIQGEDDKYATEWQLEQIEKNLPDCTSMMISGWGHSPQYKHKKQLTCIIEHFYKLHFMRGFGLSLYQA